MFIIRQRKPAKSEGATPVSGTPKKDEAREGEGGGEGRERGGGRREGGGRGEQVLSSDDEAPVIMRPRQRSLKRRKSYLTNKPTSQQLVRPVFPLSLSFSPSLSLSLSLSLYVR